MNIKDKNLIEGQNIKTEKNIGKEITEEDIKIKDCAADIRKIIVQYEKLKNEDFKNIVNAIFIHQASRRKFTAKQSEKLRKQLQVDIESHLKKQQGLEKPEQPNSKKILIFLLICLSLCLMAVGIIAYRKLHPSSITPSDLSTIS